MWRSKRSTLWAVGFVPAVYYVDKMAQVRGPIERCRKGDGTPPQEITAGLAVVVLTMHGQERRSVKS
jgi:hypothetical protein